MRIYAIKPHINQYHGLNLAGTVEKYFFFQIIDWVKRVINLLMRHEKM